MLLYALLAAPLVAALLTVFASGKDGESSFRLGLLLSVMVALLGLPLVTCMPLIDASLPWFTLWGTNATVHLHLASDGLSAWLIQLVTWLTPIAILGSRKLVGDRMRDFAASVLVMEALMIGALLSRDLVLFYLFFEAMLVPMLVLIALFGGAERRSASLWFFLYTMFGSIFMLVAIWWLAWKTGSTELARVIADLPGLRASGQLTAGGERWLFFAFALAFAVKVPLVPFHSWQAKTYSETPAGGAVLLAGAMAKIGVYGFLRFVLPMFPALSAEYAHVFVWLGLIGVVGGALVAMAQDDVKRMIAYSSLSHLSLVMVGIFSFHQAALAGVPLQMIAHGLSVAALFLLVGFLEARSSSRGLDDFGGLADRTPIFAVLFVITALASAALPGTANFIGEFMLLFGSYLGLGFAVALIAGLSVILGAVYLLRWVQRWLYGKRHPSLDRLPDLGASEILAVVPLLLASFFFGFYPKPINVQAVPVVVELARPAREAAVALKPAPAQADAPVKSTAVSAAPAHATPAAAAAPAVAAPAASTSVKP
ncbi:MAG TPA: NADH-quinone oxidoreductase subunit M [Planctomycetota bacterium]|nr:NADH-quinone oxidoreductase subunit M [Planctomycetota bacterium]